MTRARRVRRACVAVGGSRRRSRAGPFARAAVVFFSCSSPVRSPVVVLVLVSRLLYGRRSVRSEGAGGDGDARATRAARVRRRGWFSPPQSSRAVRARRGGLLLLLFSRPVAGRRPRLAPSLRPPLRAERGRGGATGDARATRAARVRRRGWFSPPQSSRAVRARRGGLLLLLFSRPVADRRPRPRLAPSLRPLLRAERGRGARGATGDARATRAARVRRRGWFSPPQSSRAVRARRGGLLLLLFSCPVAGRRPRPRLAPSLRPPLRAERGRGARGRRVTRARRARRACVAVGGSRRRSRAGPFARAAVVFFSCSSPVRSPVVVLVLVSRLLYGRRSVRSEGAGGDG